MSNRGVQKIGNGERRRERGTESNRQQSWCEQGAGDREPCRRNQ